MWHWRIRRRLDRGKPRYLYLFTFYATSTMLAFLYILQAMVQSFKTEEWLREKIKLSCVTYGGVTKKLTPKNVVGKDFMTMNMQ